jgi:hypothetical protein
VKTKVLPKVNGKEAIGFWWRGSIVEPFLKVVPVFKELSKQVEIEDPPGRISRWKKETDLYILTPLKSNAVAWVRSKLVAKVENLERLTEYADDHRVRFENFLLENSDD